MSGKFFLNSLTKGVKGYKMEEKSTEIEKIEIKRGFLNFYEKVKEEEPKQYIIPELFKPPKDGDEKVKKHKPLKINGNQIQEEVKAESAEGDEFFIPKSERAIPTNGPAMAPVIPIKKTKFASMCGECAGVTYIPIDEMDEFECPSCKHNKFSIVYYCWTCEQNFTIAKEDFLTMEEMEVLNCPVCNHELEVIKLENESDFL
jgi:Zn finger protein HypA/HybF involved in hydrogenase expression